MIRPTAQAVLILGTSPLAYKLAAAIHEGRAGRRRLLGMLSDEADRPSEAGFPVVGHVDDFEAILDELRPDRIIVALTERRGRLPVYGLLKSRLRGVVVETGVKTYERLTGKLAIESLRPSSLVFDRGLTPPRRKLALKRAVSIAVATLGLGATFPLMIVIAALIRLDSQGPILFRQDRIGRGGRRFQLLKFRSMISARHNGSEWAADNLDRVTTVGYWLRKFHLDELPQFFNILRGDMEFVGPRPHPVSNHALFDREIPYYSLRSIVRPGLTGWAQVRFGYANDLAEETEKMRYDLYYIKNQSLRLDALILLETAMKILFGRNDSSVPAASQAAEAPAMVVTDAPESAVHAAAPVSEAIFTT